MYLDRAHEFGEGAEPRRVPYMSGLTAVQSHNGGKYSYLELVEFIEAESPQAKEDLRELWTRALFTCAIGNTDNHLRNHGFLRRKRAKMQPCKWRAC